MSSNKLVHFALFTVSLIYGANYSIAKLVMPEYIKPFGVILLRASSAALFFGIVHSLFVKEKIENKKDYWRLAACGLFGVTINQLAFFKGISLTSPVNASTVMVSVPILVLAISAIVTKERITFQKIIGILLGLLGAVLIIGGTGFSIQTESAFGDVLILVNAVSYSTYLVMVKPLMARYHALTVSKWVFLFGVILVIPFGWQEVAEVHWENIPPSIWASIAFIILATTFLAYLLNIWTLKHVNSSIVGFYIYFQPLLATLIAYFFGYYDLTLEKGIYALMIFFGVYLVSRKKPLK